MGTSQIGYMVVGPETLPEAERDAVIGRASKRLVAIQKYLDSLTLDDTPYSPDLASIDPIYSDIYLEWDDVETMMSLDVERVVNDLYSLWTNGAHDSYERLYHHPDGEKRIVFAGAESWGDEPIGLGYKTLRDAERLGILADLGIG